MPVKGGKGMKKLVALLCLVLLFGNALASVALRTDDGSVLLTSSGAEIVSFGVYTDIVPLGRDLFAAVLDQKCALMDDQGTVLSDFMFDHLFFREDLLIGDIDGKWCILNEDGTLRTKAVYGSIVPNGIGGAWAIRGTNGDMASDMLLTIDPEGKETPTDIYVRSIADSAADGLIAVLPADASRYIYCDTSGKRAFEGEFDTAGTFVAGKAIVTQNGCFGAIDAEGKMILQTEYNYAEISPNGTIIALASDSVTVFGKDNNSMFKFEGEGLSAGFASEHILIHDGKTLHVFAPDGQILRNLNADASVYAGLDGELIISEGAWGEKCVYLDGTESRYQNLYPLGYSGGKPVYAYMEVRVAKYMNNLLGEVQFSADMDTARYGIVDAQGEMLLPAVYISVEAVADDRFLVRTEKQWRMIDAKGRTFWKLDAQEIIFD